jgi:hypothetical protein
MHFKNNKLFMNTYVTCCNHLFPYIFSCFFLDGRKLKKNETIYTKRKGGGGGGH